MFVLTDEPYASYLIIAGHMCTIHHSSLQITLLIVKTIWYVVIYGYIILLNLHCCYSILLIFTPIILELKNSIIHNRPSVQISNFGNQKYISAQTVVIRILVYGPIILAVKQIHK